ncbi:MAG: hypothetical protein PHO12_07855 [Bacteroidales bacterium]|nr:hypothetical protein [Bacteroidales bacterium]MDD4685121.1 hypothetical protein [Bacteroidales bacterium]
MERILKLLKPKVTSLGFNEKELESVAKSIHDNNPNLQAEDVSDEDIDKVINSVIPILGVAQQNATRVINDSKKQNQSQNQTKETQLKNSGSENTQDLSALISEAVKGAITPLEEKISKLEGEKVRGTRASRLNEVVKGAGKFGERILKDFTERTYKTFEDEEEFEAYLEETKKDVQDHIQEETNNSLNPLGNIGVGKRTISSGEASKEEIDEVISKFN